MFWVERRKGTRSPYLLSLISFFLFLRLVILSSIGVVWKLLVTVLMRLSDWTVIRMKCGGTHILLAPLVRWLHGGTEGVPYLCHRYSFPQRDIRLSQNSTACPIKTQYHTSICFTATHNIVPRLKLQCSIRTKSNGGGCKRNFHHSGSVTYLPSPFISYRKLTPATNAPFSFPFPFLTVCLVLSS